MRTTATLLAGIAGFASVAYAQNGVPTCGQPCITPYVSGSSIAGCAQLDVACICANSQFLSGISCCLEASCDPADQQQAVDFALNLCSVNGVTNLPTAVSSLCTSSVVYTGSASSSTGVAATTTSGSSSATPSGTGASTGSSSSHTSAASTGSSTGSSSAAAASKTNAAGHNVAGMGVGIIGGLAGFAALL